MKSKYINFISEVSKKFISNLNNNLLLKSKLKEMQISIDYTNSHLTSAKLISTAGCFYEMVFCINENDSEEYIKFVIGHEIAHLLFRDINMLRTSCYCPSEDSFAETYVRRQTPEGKTYGCWLEELLCDYLSLVILSKIYEKRYSMEELINMVETETNNYSTYELTEKLICTFGKTIYDKLDAFKEEIRYYCHNAEKLVLPEGCEYPRRRTVCVKKIDNKDDYIDLLLDADPSKDSIYKYLNDSDIYGLQVEENIVSLAVILHIDKNTLELKNLVTKEEYRGNGYAKKLLKSLCGNYKQKYNKMLVGTSENNIPFYVKQGFDKYEKTIKNYFVDNYAEEIWDGDLQCIDMYYYSKDLKKIKNEM